VPGLAGEPVTLSDTFELASFVAWTTFVAISLIAWPAFSAVLQPVLALLCLLRDVSAIPALLASSVLAARS
jgi:hypothetical protein